MFGKILTVLLILTFLIAGISCYFTFSNRSRIEKLEKNAIVEQKQKEKFAQDFQDLAKIDQPQPAVVVVQHPIVEPVAKKYRWRLPVLGFVIVAIIVLCRKKIIGLFKKPTVVGLVILAGIMAFSLAGSVWAEEEKPSIYDAIYKNLKIQKDWQKGWTSAFKLRDEAVAIAVGDANTYTNAKFAELLKRLEKLEKVKPVVVEQKEKIISVVRVVEYKLKPDFSNLVPQKPNINQLWGMPIVVDTEKAVEPELQQPEKPEASALAKVEELGRKFDEEQCHKIAEQEKKEKKETKITTFFMGTLVFHGE